MTTEDYIYNYSGGKNTEHGVMINSEIQRYQSAGDL